jgi:hypothetical protein
MLGSTPVTSMRLGSTLVWTRAAHYWFDVCGLLPGPMWVNELLTEGLHYISDGFNAILDQAENWYAELVSVIPVESAALTGGLISLNPPDTNAGICGVLTSTLGGLDPTDLQSGLIGLINGIPIFGGLLADILFPTALTDFNSIVGSIPILGDLGRMLGLIPNTDGSWENPINFIVDAVGDVLGWLTCDMINAETIEASIQYVVGGICNMARMLIPDGLVGLDPTSGIARFFPLVTADDGYLMTIVASLGDPGFYTRLFRRYINDGTGGAGVGISMTDSQLGIVRRVGNVDTVVADAGTYGVGDKLLLEQTGDVHTLYRNGSIAASWADNGHTAAKGASYRSMALEMSGAKEHMGPRRFSPGLLMVETM